MGFAQATCEKFDALGERRHGKQRASQERFTNSFLSACRAPMESMGWGTLLFWLVAVGDVVMGPQCEVLKG